MCGRPAALSSAAEASERRAAAAGSVSGSADHTVAPIGRRQLTAPSLCPSSCLGTHPPPPPPPPASPSSRIRVRTHATRTARESRLEQLIARTSLPARGTPPLLLLLLLLPPPASQFLCVVCACVRLSGNSSVSPGGAQCVRARARASMCGCKATPERPHCAAPRGKCHASLAPTGGDMYLVHRGDVFPHGARARVHCH